MNKCLTFATIIGLRIRDGKEEREREREHKGKNEPQDINKTFRQQTDDIGIPP